jgi:hypothetical protein
MKQQHKPKALGCLDCDCSAGHGVEGLLHEIVGEGTDNGSRPWHGGILSLPSFLGGLLPVPKVRRNHDVICETDHLGIHGPHWCETKTAVLLRMTSVELDIDPHLDLPKCFAAARIASYSMEASACKVSPKGLEAKPCLNGLAHTSASARTICFDWYQNQSQGYGPNISIIPALYGRSLNV